MSVLYFIQTYQKNLFYFLNFMKTDYIIPSKWISNTKNVRKIKSEMSLPIPPFLFFIYFLSISVVWKSAILIVANASYFCIILSLKISSRIYNFAQENVSWWEIFPFGLYAKTVMYKMTARCEGYLYVYRFL